MNQQLIAAATTAITYHAFVDTTDEKLPCQELNFNNVNVIKRNFIRCIQADWENVFSSLCFLNEIKYCITFWSIIRLISIQSEIKKYKVDIQIINLISTVALLSPLKIFT